jgi:hypothetical protein
MQLFFRTFEVILKKFTFNQFTLNFQGFYISSLYSSREGPYSIVLNLHRLLFHMLGFCELHDEQNSENSNVNLEMKALLRQDTKRHVLNSLSIVSSRSQCMQIISIACSDSLSLDFRSTKMKNLKLFMSNTVVI